MALVGNGVRLSTINPMKQTGAASVGSQTPVRERTSGTMRGRYASAAWDTATRRYGSIPYGYRPPYTYLLAPKSGGMRSYVEGVATLTASGAMGVNGVGAAAGVATLAATGQLVVSGSGTAAGVATLAGNLLAVLNAAGTAAGVAAPTAIITALGWINATAAGVATLTATRYATGELAGEVNIGASDPLSAENLAAAVWAALAADNNDAGSMGEKLNDAGGAADPWDDSRALTVAKFLGLK